MPASSHQEYIRENPQGKTAVLFIHGILGTPAHFRDFIKIVPDEYAVYNILLDGHGGSAQDFAKASMRLWRKTVLGKMEYLAERYENIVIVAHSMGTLLAINAGISFPCKVKQLFLIAVPLKMSVRPAAVLTSLKIALNRVHPGDSAAVAARAACGTAPAKRLYAYLGWIPRFLELFWEARDIRKRIGLLDVPAAAFQSRKDELVSMKSCRYLYGNPRISVRIMPNSMHYYYDKAEYDDMLRHFLNELQAY